METTKVKQTNFRFKNIKEMLSRDEMRKIKAGGYDPTTCVFGSASFPHCNGIVCYFNNGLMKCCADAAGNC